MTSVHYMTPGHAKLAMFTRPRAREIPRTAILHDPNWQLCKRDDQLSIFWAFALFRQLGPEKPEELNGSSETDPLYKCHSCCSQANLSNSSKSECIIGSIWLECARLLGTVPA